MTRRARLASMQERNVNLALMRKRRGLPWAHLSKRQQAMYRAWIETLYGGRDAATLAATDGNPASTDDTAHTDVRGEGR